MFRKKRREKILREQETRQTQERFERNECAGKEIYARMAELKNVPRENLPDTVFMLSMAAKHQSEQIRQSGGRLPEQGSGHATGVLRLPGRALETPADDQSH
jgi:hypothetical protein